MRYRPGDRVRIKDMKWYIDNKNEYGEVDCGEQSFTESMALCCGEVLTIEGIASGNCYFMKGEAYWWNDEMIEGLADARETPIEHPCDWLKRGLNLPDGYEFQDENGNAINTKKITLVKKKPKYPTTYEECCKLLNIPILNMDVLDNMLDSTDMCYRKSLDRKLGALRKLLICRDAYWEIAGEEIGLGKPWEPSKDKMVYSIYRHCNEIETDIYSGESVTFEFPTAEIRDAFYENFKDLIESCKELL